MTRQEYDKEMNELQAELKLATQAFFEANSQYRKANNELQEWQLIYLEEMNDRAYDQMKSIESDIEILEANEKYIEV